LKNIVLSFQLLFQQRYLHFAPGEKVRGNVRGKWTSPSDVNLVWNLGVVDPGSKIYIFPRQISECFYFSWRFPKT